MTDPHETKYNEMQKYVPFIQRVIEKLKLNNEQQTDNPRKAQLQKMEMLHDLLTNKHKKIKIETLMKCEGVLIKLQAKIEKNEDVILNDIKLKQQTIAKTSTCTVKNTNVEEIESELGPASPPPEIIPAELDQPVEIPTERCCSPILVKETIRSSRENLQQHKHSTSTDFESLRRNVFNADNVIASSLKQGYNHDKKAVHHQQYRSDALTQSDQKEHHLSKGSQLTKHFDKKTNVEHVKSPVPGQKQQTVKVVITEPLPDHIKKQHFPSRNFLPTSPTCHYNLKAFPKASKTKEDSNEAYNPEELWDTYNESQSERPSARNTSTAPVVGRLGTKVADNSLSSCSLAKPVGRYTPIPDVLKSPPLSVSDINNLLLESGGDKLLNDISAIGSRRPVKIEENKIESPNNSFELVRKKLAQTARMNSLQCETSKLESEKDACNISSKRHERLALKYNPHPRQERLQSTSSTDGSECSSQSKINDHRFKLTLQTSTMLNSSPTQVVASNVNVLPAINLSDPRLKKQNAVQIPSERTSLPPNSSPNINMCAVNKSPISYGNRKDPRLPRAPNNTSLIRTTPTQQGVNLNALQHSSEENWDSDEGEKTNPTIKSQPRISGTRGDSRSLTADIRNTLNPPIPATTATFISRSSSQNNVNAHQIKHKVQQANKQNDQKDILSDSKKSKNTLTPVSKFVIPNPPKSDTEEDWDSDDETTKVRPKATTSDVAQIAINRSAVVPVIAPYHSQMSPNPFVNAIHLQNTSLPIPHAGPIPHLQSQYSKLGSNSNQQHSLLKQSPNSNNRFNCMLNDKSERIKYLEAKKQKTIEPRTYKEFREAKERAQAQEAAIKRATDEAEAMKRTQKVKDVHKEKECKEKKEQIDTSKKTEGDKKETKIYNKKNLAPESTLDKMYRTQNFNSKFPKSNTTFKIPKKKTEVKPKEDEPKVPELSNEQTANVSNQKLEVRSSTDNKNSLCKALNHKETDKNLSNFSYKSLATNEKLENNKEKVITSNENSVQKDSIQKDESSFDKTKDKFENHNISKNISTKPSNKRIEDDSSPMKKEEEEKCDELLYETDDNKLKARDPRCRPKINIQSKEPHDENNKVLRDIIITSAEDQMVLKPQQNLDKFNKLTPQPQRVLRRRNTMVVFDSAPLVDKEKLKNANALLFEDVQEEEKRKRKQDEDDRLVTRRNKNLEEIFKKTDDNCSVSTQNIITGKRRTRATINFNETVNVINVFKHKTIKDSSLSIATSTPPSATQTPATQPPAIQPIKAVKSNFKIKLRNLDFSDKKLDEGREYKNLETFIRKESKIKETKGVRTKSSKELKLKDETESIESDSEAKTSTKLLKKRQLSFKTLSTNNVMEDTQTAVGDNIGVQFKPIQNDEHQNCAVSSTSTDNFNLEENTYSLSSTKNHFKNELDDNEPSSTGSKSNMSTPTSEQHVLNEIVDRILKPNADRDNILGLLGQILNEEKLELIKSLMESNNKAENDEQQIMEESAEVNKEKIKASSKTNTTNDYEDEEQDERRHMKTNKVLGVKNVVLPKKKRSELDRLNEDIRDMFICEGVLTATGRRMCTIMGKDVDSPGSKKTSKESTPILMSEQEKTSAKKEEKLKPPVNTRPLRRSVRCKITEENEDDESQSTNSRTTDESFDDFNSTDNSTTMDTTPHRKMPLLKAHSPIKNSEELSSKSVKVIKRKSERKCGINAKKSKTIKKDHIEDTVSEDEESQKNEEENNREEIIKNTNIHWHNQSKFTTWCMICKKKILANLSSQHYKTHHRENYISRIAPVLLQQFKQGKLNQPLFGVKKAQKQPSWFYKCPFCLKYFNTPMPLWLEHFQNHTVEFRYECSKCHRCSNRKLTVSRHIKNCEGATIITSDVKSNISTAINSHVCHLCNFIQLKRVNLERHYIEQHKLKKKTVDLLGYVIKLFDVENVECVTEENALEREQEAWKSIEANEQVIDIEDDEDTCTSTAVEGKQGEKENEVENIDNIHHEKKASTACDKDKKEHSSLILRNTIETLQTLDGNEIEANSTQLKSNVTEEGSNLANQSRPVVHKIKEERSTSALKGSIGVVPFDLAESESNDCEMIEERETVQHIQNELLALAAEAAGKENEKPKPNEKECEKETTEGVVSQEMMDGTSKATINHQGVSDPQTSMSDIISCSIDMIYSRGCGVTDDQHRKSIDVEEEAKKCALPDLNVFMPTRDENNYSPTIQILAQSIINIEEQENESAGDKPMTMAERLTQRFKGLQNQDDCKNKSTTDHEAANSINKCSKENAFEKLINDTLLELTKEKDSSNNLSSKEIASAKSINKEQTKENDFNKIFRETPLELETDNCSDSQIIRQTETKNTTCKDSSRSDVITVISDDEDWEDIEITETAPTTSTSGLGNIQKSKSKGLFQKFGIFKGNSSKSKKHLTPLVYIPKKKSKEKYIQSAILMPSSSITSAAVVTTTKANDNATNNSQAGSGANLGFKPLINIMDGLFPDSPCNDPIDLVPELAPLEPLQDLNDILSILDSNLSAVNINAADNHTSIEDALDFISEQQANDKEKSTSLSYKSIMPSQGKTTINNISHVGFSVQANEENAFKFYCLLQNCSFLYSSDSVGLENHFMCEHSQIKWNGYCLMCQEQTFPISDGTEEHSISKEIRHMLVKHANKSGVDLSTDSTQHSTTSSHENEDKPKIKLRRLTGDCLSRATPENTVAISGVTVCANKVDVPPPISMLGALLVADPKPPTKEMPPQLQLPLTEPLLLNNSTEVSAQVPFRNVNSDFLITSVTSSGPKPNQSPLQISSVISLNKAIPPTSDAGQIQVPKISNVCTLVPKTSQMCSKQIEKENLQLVDVTEESLEVSSILENASKISTYREVSRSVSDSPVIVAETMPLAQSKTGDFVVTQTVSAQYNDFSSAALGFNISIAASTTADKTNPEQLSAGSSSGSIASRQYKCMGNGCKFVSRVPVAMSDHLRFHERRNFSNKRDYLSCGFCFYCARDIEDYMKHANNFHIISKGNAVPHGTVSTETDTATSLTQKIQNILNNSSSSCTAHGRYSVQSQLQQQSTPVQDTQEVYLKKLRETIDEIVGPTGLADEKLYRCIVKNCYTQLTEGTFLSHIMFHITSNGGNPNNYVFKCPHCTAQYHRVAGIKAHIKNHARNRYFCYLCDETSTNPGQLLKHFSEKHWHTLNMYTKELLKPKTTSDGSELVLDSGYYVAYTQDLSPEEVRKFGEKLILEWQRKKSGSKTHFKSTEIDLLPLSAIFLREVNCGECEYKTKVRTNMFRHLLMHKQNPGMANKSGESKVCSVDPVNPVPCLNSSERFFDKMTNLASSSLIPSSGVPLGTKSPFKIPYCFVEETNRYTCGCQGCNYRTISEDLFRTHLATLHTTAMTYSCTFCQEEICKRGITIDRIMNHTRFHGATIYHCEECNYVHHLRYVVERHVNEKHTVMKVNIITHNRSNEDNVEGTTTVMPYAGKKYKETVEDNQTAQTSSGSTRTTNSEMCGPKPVSTSVNSGKGKGKWMCHVCGHRTSTVSQMQTHCQQLHGVRNQYKCAHCNFGSQQLSQILSHIDEKHSGKTREARTMYHKAVNSGEEVADTRPLWQRNDPTRVRHIRGILMEDEEESEEYRKKLALLDDVDDDSNEDKVGNTENDEELNTVSFMNGYEFGCYHCSFKTASLETLKSQHYEQNHNYELETAKPFWYRLHRRLCCPECRTFIGSYNELQQHLQNSHKNDRFYAADIRIAENDNISQRILCGYCSFHCANTDNLYRHHLRVQHCPQDIRIDNNQQIMEILSFGKAEMSFQCTLCAKIYPNRVATVQHACNSHAGEDSFSFRELTNSLIYRCNLCCFTSTAEKELLRHAIDHYGRFKVCHFCRQPQTSFNVYMQHCYAEHRNDIQKFKTIYPLTDIRKFLLQILIIFPIGLVLSKRNLINTKYGKTDVIDELYEDIYKISQQPPIPRLSIARLVARKSIEAQHKHVECLSSSQQEQTFEEMQPRHKTISKRRRTEVFSVHDNINGNSLLKPKCNIVEGKINANITKRRTTIDHDQQNKQPQSGSDFNVPLKLNKICKRRSTVAVDSETLFSSNLMPSYTNLLLTENTTTAKKRKTSCAQVHNPSPQHVHGTYPVNSDIEPFSFYGQKPEKLDLTKIYTKVAIGGIKTPLTIDKFKVLFDVECQLKLTKCDENQLTYNDYKHIKMPCPASHKLRFHEVVKKAES